MSSHRRMREVDLDYGRRGNTWLKADPRLLFLFSRRLEISLSESLLSLGGDIDQVSPFMNHASGDTSSIFIHLFIYLYTSLDTAFLS